MNTHTQGGIYCAHTLIPCLSYSTAFKRNVMSRLAWWLKPCKNFRYFNFLFDSLFVFDPGSIVLSKKKKEACWSYFNDIQFLFTSLPSGACPFLRPSSLHCPSFYRPERMCRQQWWLLPHLQGPENRLRVWLSLGVQTPGQKDLWR